MNGGTTRRDFLRAVLLAIAAGSCAACRAPGEPEPPWLARIIYRRPAAARLGVEYLQAHPQEHRAAELIALIERRVQSGTGLGETAADAGQAVAGLQRLVATEYARGDVIRVAGWILSRTEARLYALTALSG